jgi:hypothetical protein
MEEGERHAVRIPARFPVQRVDGIDRGWLQACGSISGNRPRRASPGCRACVGARRVRRHRRAKALVDVDAIAVAEPVGLVRERDDGHQLAEHLRTCP